MGRLYDLLPQEHKRAIKNRIETYGGFQGENIQMTAPLDYVLRFWEKAKEKYYDMFGGNFIISKRIQIEKDVEELYLDMRNFLECKGQPFIRWLMGDYCYWKLPSSDEREILQHLIWYCNLVENKYVEGPTGTITRPDGKFIHVTRGCKVSRVLQKIAHAYGCPEKVIEDFRIGHSMVLNDKSLVGDLCLSIHPLDFMTMSDNDCDWDSCMAWSTYKGEYRQGTVEMMNSPYIVMAYLANPTPMTLETGFEWSNKQWRQLMVVTDEILMGIKSYPYNNDQITEAALTWLKELSGKNFAKSSCAIIPFRSYTYPQIDKNIRIEFEMHHMYSDITSNGHMGFINLDLSNSNQDTLYYCLSGETECLACGEDCSGYYDGDFSTEFIACADCLDVVKCWDCGDWMYKNNAVLIDDNYYCECCAENYIQTCPWCGDRIDSRDQLVELDVILGKSHYYRTMCRNCFEDITDNFDEEDEEEKKYLDSIIWGEEYLEEPTLVTINIANWDEGVVEEVLNISKWRIKEMKEYNQKNF